MTDTADTASYPLVIFRQVRVFDGVNNQVTDPCDVLVGADPYDYDGPVRDGIVLQIAPKIDEVTTSEPAEVTEINGGGTRVLMPGLIDAHWHFGQAAITPQDALTWEPGYLHAVMTKQAERTLMRGFTTVRDMGGPVFGLKRAIDEGIVLGPRIYPSGAYISQSGGHGEFRQRTEVPRDGAYPLIHGERIGATIIADGVPEVLRATREQLMLGASQIKVMAGGGVASNYDPIDVTEYTKAEMEAAVQAAENWGTYVTVHAYMPKAIQQSIDAGVKCIEHGHLIDEETVQKYIVARDVWWCLQPFFDDEDANPMPDPAKRVKQQLVNAGTVNAYNLAIKHEAKIAWGTDTVYSPTLCERQGAQLAKLTYYKPPGRETPLFSPYDALRMATSDNAELLKMSGERNPYRRLDQPGPSGLFRSKVRHVVFEQLGCIREAALADLLLVEGNPLEDITLIENPDKNFVVIMKSGSIVKNILPPG